MAQVSVRVLKDSLSEYVRRAEAGERVLVTRDGRPVAVLAPMTEARGTEAALSRLVAAGLLSRVPEPATCLPPVGELGPGTPLSAIVLEDRR